MKIVDDKNLNIPNDLKNFNEMLGKNVPYDIIKSRKKQSFPLRQEIQSWKSQEGAGGLH